MGYFAGGGSGKGWNLFYFILTPDEFKELWTVLFVYRDGFAR